MKSIVIGFSHPIKLSLHAYIIEKIDHASFDHAYLRFHSDSLDRDIIYQSNWRGVEFIGSTLWKTTTMPVEEYTIAVDDAEYTSMMQFCVDNCGISYGYLGTIGAGFVKLASYFRIKIENPFNDGLKTEFCSEIISRCLNVIDPAKFQLDAENITPNNLNQLLKKLNIARIL